MDNKVVQWVTRSTPLESRGTWKKFVQERKGFDEGGLATPKRGLVDEPGSYAGSNLSAKNLKKYNKISKILYDRGEISSPNYLDLEYLSKDHNKVMARKDREIIKKKDGTLDFKSGREKPLRLDQQAKLKKRFPEADFSKGKYGFAVDSAKEQYAKRYFKQGYKETLKEGLTTKQIVDIKERFPEIPKKDWNFLTKDNPKGFKYGLAGTGEGGKYATMGKRIAGYLEGKTWFDRFAPGLNANSQNYLLTSFERIAEHEDKLKPSERTYKRIKNKDGKIIGFQDNTPTGKGKKYYMVNSKIKGGTPITKHPGYAKGAEITKYVEATKGMKIGGAKFNDLISESMKTKPGGFGVTPWERHHIYGTAKTGFGGMPGEIMLLSRDQNRAVEGVRKAYYRGADSRYGKPISFEQADKRLKKIGAALDLDGRLAGTIVSPQQTIQSAGKAAGIKPSAMQELMSRTSMGIDPTLLPKAAYQELIKPAAGVAGKAVNVGLGPTGLIGLNVGLGVDPTQAMDRIGIAGEAALAKPLVQGSLSVTDKIKTPLLRKIVERASLAGMSPAMALRAARIASPLGLASLGVEGLYHLGKAGYDQYKLMQDMSEDERREFLAQQYEDLGGVAGEGA